MKKDKMTQNKAFMSLSKKKQNIVRLLFEDDLTDQEIADTVSCSRSTISRLKQDPVFIQAQQEYSISQLNNALPNAIKELLKLIRNGKSEMVKLQAIQTVLKQAGLFADNGTPELDQAKIRKANADARVAEARARVMEKLDDAEDNKLEQLMDKLISENSKDKKKT